MIVDIIRMVGLYVDQLTPSEIAAWIGGMLLGIALVVLWGWASSYVPEPLSYGEGNHAHKR